jgi:lysozyme family protein
VNAGPQTARRFLQRAANDLGAGLMVDGTLGPISVAAINAIDAHKLLLRFAQRVYDDHYLAIVAKDPTQACFLNGWRNRLSEVPILNG